MQWLLQTGDVLAGPNLKNGLKALRSSLYLSAAEARETGDRAAQVSPGLMAYQADRHQAWSTGPPFLAMFSSAWVMSATGCC